jgi:hypothetical protein
VFLNPGRDACYIDNNDQQMALAKARVGLLQSGMEQAWFALEEGDRRLENLTGAGL